VSRQLILDLPHLPAMDRADFVTGEANRAAVALIDRWPDWPARTVLLSGPSGSGKSHLAAIWQADSGAAAISAAALGDADAEMLVAGGAALVEDLHVPERDERALFHLLNLARERGAAVLMTSREPAAGLRIALPDLASRLRAATPAALAPPDDDLLKRVLTKLFADRQIAVEPAVIAYVATRIERSLEAANRVVAWLDRESLVGGRAVTRPLAGEAVAALFGGEEE
jgi:chromosomal replication initiation ATPase DnaA